MALVVSGGKIVTGSKSVSGPSKTPSARQQAAIDSVTRTGGKSKSGGSSRTPDRNSEAVKNIYPQTVSEQQSSVQPTSQYVSPERVLAQDPNVVASTRNQGEYISASGKVVTPIASYAVPASGFENSRGVITKERAAPTQYNRPAKDFKKVVSGYEPVAARAGTFFQEASSQGRELGERFTAKGMDRDNGSFASRAFYGTLAYPTRAVSYGAGVVASPLQRYAASDKTLGRDIVVGYAGGRALGIGAGEFSNFAGRAASSRFGPLVGAKAYGVTTNAVGVVGAGALGLSVYGKSSSELGRELPGLVAGGFGAVKGYKSSRPGVVVDQISPVSATRGTAYYEQGIVSGASQQTRVARLTEFGVPRNVQFESNTLLSGNSPRGAGYYNVEATSYGRIPVGKGIPYSESFRGVVTPSQVGLVSQDTGLLFLSRSGKPSTFFSEGGVTNIQQARSRFNVFDISGPKVKVVRSGRANSVFEGFDFNQVNAGVMRLPSGEALGLRTQSVVPKSFFESVTGSAEVSGRSSSRSAFRGDVFTILQRENVVRGGGYSFTDRLPKGFNKRGSLSLGSPELVREPVVRGRYGSLSLEGLGVGRASGALVSPRLPGFFPTLSFGRESTVGSSRSNLLSLPSTSVSVGQTRRSSPVLVSSPLITLDTQRTRSASSSRQGSLFTPSTNSVQRPTQIPAQDLVLTPVSRPPRPPSIGSPSGSSSPLLDPPFSPGFFPPLGGVGGGVSKRGRRAKNSRQYSPSFFAKALNIRGGSNPRSGGYTGLELRGLLPSSGGRRKKGSSRRIKL